MSRHPSHQPPYLSWPWRSLRQVLPVCGLLTVLVGLAYWPCAHNGFIIYDDPGYVIANPHVNTGITYDNIKWAFSSFHQANWHPLTWISHMLDCQLYGLNAPAHHRTSVQIHTLNTLLLFGLLFSITGTLWRSFFVAAFFGLHPLRVESVAWISERKDVLSMLFFLLCLFSYSLFVRSRRQLSTCSTGTAAGGPLPGAWASTRSVVFYCSSLLLFACGLLSKPMIVSLPFILLLLDLWPFRRQTELRWPLRVLEKAPFFLLTLLSCVVTFIAQKQDNAVFAISDLPAHARMANALVAYPRYLEKFLVPTGLSLIYPLPERWPAMAVAGSLLLLATVSVLAWSSRHDYPYLWVGWCWFLGTLVPVIGLVQVGVQSMADRYTYLPSIGLLLMLVWGAGAIGTRLPRSQKAFLVSGLLLLGGCIALTWQTTRFWKTSEALLRHSLAANPHNFAIQALLGNALWKSGQPDEARVHFHEALEFKPSFVHVYVVGKEGTWAIPAQAPLVRPGRADSTEAVSSPSLQTQIDQLERDLTAQPQNYTLQNALGGLLLRSGDIEGAIKAFKRAVELKPNYAQAHNNLGIALCGKGAPAEAITTFETAIQLEPNYAPSRYNLALVLNARGQKAQAIAQLQEALRIDTNYLAAQHLLESISANKPL